MFVTPRYWSQTMLLELEEGGFVHYFTSEVLVSLGHGTAVWAAPKFRLAQGFPAS